MKHHHGHSKEIREQLTGEHKVGDAGQIILACLFMAVWITDTFIFLHFISRYEERLLLSRFGEAYELYMQDVPMWIPRLKKEEERLTGVI